MLPAGWQMAIELRQVPLYPSQIAPELRHRRGYELRRLFERRNERAGQPGPFRSPAELPALYDEIDAPGLEATSSTSRSSRCRLSWPAIRASSTSNPARISAILPGTSRIGASGHRNLSCVHDKTVVSELFDPAAWAPVEGFSLEDVTYHRALAHGTVRVAIDRPEVRNAFRPRTVDELYLALDHARQSPDVGCVLLTGNGPSPKDGGWAFSSGGDQRVRGKGGYEYEPAGAGAPVPVPRVWALLSGRSSAASTYSRSNSSSGSCRRS